MYAAFTEILIALGWPPIFLIPHFQFAMLEGEEYREENSVGNFVMGIAAWDYPVITVHPHLEGKTLENVLWHEVGHHLWPWRQHWWIEVFGEKMARGGGRGVYAKRYNKTVKDLPPRGTLLKMARRQSEKLKVTYRIARTDGGNPIPHPDYKPRPEGPLS
jgi:hypothetical protein